MKRLAMVLAGGQSTRMGTDKRWLRSGDSTWLERAVRAATESAGGGATVCVSGGAEAPEGAELVVDAVTGRGPVEGLRSVAARIEGDAWLLVLPVDMPGVDSGVLEPLWAAAREAGPGARYAEGELPMVIRIDSRSRRAIEDVAGSEEPRARSFRELDRRLGLARVAAPAAFAASLANVNTPEELARWSGSGE